MTPAQIDAAVEAQRFAYNRDFTTPPELVGLLPPEALRTLLAPEAGAEDRLRFALRLALEYWKHRQQRYKNRRPEWVHAAEAALAPTSPSNQEKTV